MEITSQYRSMDQLLVPLNTSVTLTCVVRAVPGPSFNQLTGSMNKTVNIASADQCQEQHSVETVVSPVSLEETGTIYKCVSGNSIVNYTDTIILEVQG